MFDSVTTRVIQLHNSGRDSSSLNNGTTIDTSIVLIIDQMELGLDFF